MRIKIIKSEAYSYEDCDIIAGKFTAFGWVTTIQVMDDHRAVISHGNRDTAVMGDAGKIYELGNSKYTDQPELMFSLFLGGEKMPLEIVSEVLNLTQHTATEEQGCIEPINKGAVQSALTFDAIPSVEEMEDRASFLVKICKEANVTSAMIGGAPFFMSTLEKTLLSNGIQPLYAFSERVSEEVISADGTVTKTNVFKHVGFVKIK